MSTATNNRAATPDYAARAQALPPMRHVLRPVPAYTFEASIGTSSDLATIFYEGFMDNYNVVPYTTGRANRPDYYVCYNGTADEPCPAWLDALLREAEGYPPTLTAEDLAEYEEDSEEPPVDYWPDNAPTTTREAIERLIERADGRREAVDDLPYTITTTGYCQGDYARVLWLTADNIGTDQTYDTATYPEWLADEVRHTLWDCPISGELTISDADGEYVYSIDAADLTEDGYDWDKDKALAAIARLTEGEEYAPHLLAWAEAHLPADNSLPHWY